MIAVNIYVDEKDIPRWKYVSVLRTLTSKPFDIYISGAETQGSHDIDRVRIFETPHVGKIFHIDDNTDMEVFAGWNANIPYILDSHLSDTHYECGLCFRSSVVDGIGEYSGILNSRMERNIIYTRLNENDIPYRSVTNINAFAADISTMSKILVLNDMFLNNTYTSEEVKFMGTYMIKKWFTVNHCVVRNIVNDYT